MLNPVLLYLFRLRPMRHWKKRLIASGRFLGAPFDEEKLWPVFKRRIVQVILSRVRLYLLKTIRLRITNVRIKTITPVKPRKKFIITLMNIPLSEAATERCIQSARQHGEEQQLEIMPAIDKFNAQKFFTRHSLTYDTNAACSNPLPGMGCFSSHFKLWLHCIELNEEIVVLEHDAVFKAPIPALRFQHVIVLGKPCFKHCERVLSFINPRKKKGNTHDQVAIKGREILYPWNFLMGTHAYAIKPEGAYLLVEAAKRELLPPVDHFMRKKHIDILYYDPYIVDLDNRFSSIHYYNTYQQHPCWESYKSTQ